MKTFSIHFNGYWDYDFHYPDSSYAIYEEMKIPGVYCIYRCKLNGDEVLLKQLVYIGQSENIYNRLAYHGKFDEFKEYLKRGEQLCISFAEVRNKDDRERIESALIFKHCPPCNVASTTTFKYLPTKVSLSGETFGLNKTFTVG